MIRFPMIAPAVTTAAQIMPKAENDVPSTLFIAATTRKITAISAMTAIMIRKIGFKPITALNPRCTASHTAVAMDAILVAAAAAFTAIW